MTDASPTGSSTESEDSDLVTLATAAEMLEMRVEEAEVMARDGMLTPEDTPTGPRYRLAEIKAVRLQGG